MQFSFVEKTVVSQFGPDKQVLFDCQRWDQGEFLEYRADSQRARVMDPLQLDRLATEAKAALGRRVYARKNLDQGRFAGAVFAKQNMDFPGAQPQIYLIEG